MTQRIQGVDESTHGGSAQIVALQQVHAISQELITEEKVDRLYERILDAATTVMRSEYSSIQMLDDSPAHRGELRLLGHRGFNPAAALFWTWVRPASQSTCGAALRTGTRVMVSDVEACEWMAGSDDLATYRQTGIRSVQTTPLLSRDGRILGMISTHWSRPHLPADADFRLLDVLARQAADLIERSQREEVLGQSEARFRALVGILSDVPWLADAGGAFTSHQPTWTAYTGQSFAESLGLGWLNAFHADDRPGIASRLRDGRDAAAPIQTEGRLWHGATARWRRCIVKAAPILAPEGAVQEWVGACVDVEEQRSARDVLLDERENAEQKSDAKTTFLSALSHELRNPLNAIGGYVDLLSQEIYGEVTDEQRKPLERIRQSTDALLLLIKDILDLSRIESGRLEYVIEAVDLGTVVDSALAMAEPQLRVKELRLDYAPLGNVTVVADAERLQQIVLNIVGNAIKFTPPGGRIGVDVHRRDARRDQVFLRVRDTGPGIPDAVQAAIFEPFVRAADQRIEGSGLGLAISRRLARDMGGDLRVRSAEGKGAVFTLTLRTRAR